MILNYKGLDYRTEWLEYPEIEPKLKSLGGKPTDKRDDETDKYTLPAIHDSESDAVVTDSFVIAKYLDEKYPSTPSFVPRGCDAAIILLDEHFMGYFGHIYSVIIRPIIRALNPPSAKFFSEAHLQRSDWEDVVKEDDGPGKTEAYAKFRECLEQLASVYDKNGKETIFFINDSFSFADCITIAFLKWVRTMVGVDSEEWKILENCAGGRWTKQIAEGEKWMEVK